MPEVGAGTASDTYIVPELMVAGEIRGQNGPPRRLDLGERVDFGVGEVTEAEPRPTARGWAAVVISDDPDVADASLMSIHDLASGELWSGPFAVAGSPSSAFVTHDVTHVVLWEATGIRVLDAGTGEQTARIDHGGSGTLWVWLPMGPGPGILTDVSGTSVIFDSETFEVLATGLDLGTQAAFNSTGDRYAGRRGDLLVVGRWNTDTLEVEEEFEILNPGEVVPAFDASGTYIFGGSSKGVQAWDASDGAPIMPLVPGPGGASWGAESLFQVRDDTYHLWNTDPTTWAATACEVAGRNLTVAEWEQHMPDDEPYRATCPDFPSPAIE